MDKKLKEINTRSLSANISKVYYDYIAKMSKKYTTPKGTYAKILLVKGLDSYKNEGIAFSFQEEQNANEWQFISFRVTNGTYEKIQTMSMHSKLSVAQIAGYLIEHEIKKEIKEGK